MTRTAQPPTPSPSAGAESRRPLPPSPGGDRKAPLASKLKRRGERAGVRGESRSCAVMIHADLQSIRPLTLPSPSRDDTPRRSRLTRRGRERVQSARRHGGAS
jgi:hypothetical protein